MAVKLKIHQGGIFFLKKNTHQFKLGTKAQKWGHRPAVLLINSWISWFRRPMEPGPVSPNRTTPAAKSPAAEAPKPKSCFFPALPVRLNTLE
jgi:hypothetical protein